MGVTLLFVPIHSHESWRSKSSCCPCYAYRIIKVQLTSELCLSRRQSVDPPCFDLRVVTDGVHTVLNHLPSELRSLVKEEVRPPLTPKHLGLRLKAFS